MGTGTRGLAIGTGRVVEGAGVRDADRSIRRAADGNRATRHATRVPRGTIV